MCFVVKKKKSFNDQPFAYHQEIELEISTLTNLGSGLGRVQIENPESKIENSSGWVVMVPFTLPGERVRARVFRNHKNFSEADLVSVLTPSPHRVAPGCPLFGRCGGCQYQHLTYNEQLKWKQQQVAELLQHMAGIEFPVSPVVPSPRDYGYRSKITPHFAAPRRFTRDTPGSASRVLTSESQEQSVPGAVSDPNSELRSSISDPASAGFAIGFLRQGTRFDIVDVPRCPIATDAINDRLTEVRARVHENRETYTRGATLLLRDASGTVTTDYDAIVTETVGDLKLHFLARDFFQNNPFILPAFTRYVREQAAASGARFLVDAYCGSGLFALSAASAF
ncbi:MAG TPA: TRAM domain-containing protein, partial [Opitutus sp.]|nr:TRAM domain-containing protein [Opitutus sp.]